MKKKEFERYVLWNTGLVMIAASTMLALSLTRLKDLPDIEYITFNTVLLAAFVVTFSIIYYNLVLLKKLKQGARK